MAQKVRNNAGVGVHAGLVQTMSQKSQLAGSAWKGGSHSIRIASRIGGRATGMYLQDRQDRQDRQ